MTTTNPANNNEAAASAEIKALTFNPASSSPGPKPVFGNDGVVVEVISNNIAFEVPPPGAGLTTVTASGPAVAISEAVIEAVSWVEDT